MHFVKITKFFTEFLHIFSVLGNASGQEENESADPTEKPQQKIDYSKLDLNTNLLKGSRYAIEQKKEGKLIEVYHAIEVVDISKVDVETMSIRVEIHLSQRWQANELEFPEGLFMDDDPPETYIQVDPNILDSMWSPESYIPSARETKIASFTVQQDVVNIFQNKTIIHKVRFYTVLGCLFDFQWYPLDKQTCSLTIESYTTRKALLRYMWEDNQPPVVTGNIKLLQYDLHLPLQPSNGSADRWGRGGRYPYVKLDFTFERQLGHHMIQVFIPTSLIVILSWFSFWLGLDAIPGRITLLITCVLTLVTMHSGTKGSIPPVNYIKMLDIWMVGCMTFVFLAMCEFIVVKFLHWRKQQELKRAQENDQQMKIYLEKVKEIDEKNGTRKSAGHGKKRQNFNPYLDLYRNMGAWNSVPLPGSVLPKTGVEAVFKNEFGAFEYYPQNPMDNAKPKGRPIWVVIDRVSRALFPLTFGVFNAVFWPWLLVGSENQ